MGSSSFVRTSALQALEDGVDVTGVRLEREDLVERKPWRELRVPAHELAKVLLLFPCAHRVSLHEPVRVVAREAALHEREQHALAEEQEVARLQVPAHSLGEDDEPFDEPAEPLEHVVEREKRVGHDDALGGRVRDVALVPQRNVLEPDECGRPHDAREPADSLRDDGVPLVRHRGRALLSATERLLDLAHLGSREVAHFERELLERRAQRARARSAARHAGRAEGSASSSVQARARAARTRFARRPGRSPSTSPPRPRASRRAVRRAHARRASGFARARTPSLRASARASSARHARRAFARSSASSGAPPPGRRLP